MLNGSARRQVVLLVAVNAFVGAMVGLERTVLPLLAEGELGVESTSAMLSFLVSFGLVKASANLVAGRWADAWGRKKVLVTGWLVGLPVPLLVAYAPSWAWVVAANALLGVQQGFCWSASLLLKMDHLGPRRRGLASGLNEFAGYAAVSLAAALTGYLASSYGLRPVPFLPGVLFALAGLLLSATMVSEAVPLPAPETTEPTPPAGSGIRRDGRRRARRSVSLFAASQAGLVNNYNDAMVWGLLPLLMAAQGLSPDRIGLVAAAYPAVWALGQLFTGPLSDRIGRRVLIVGGLWTQGAGIASFLFARDFQAWGFGAVLLGVGTAMVYPTLLAAVGDVAIPERRGASLGAFRFWRDIGYAAGGLGSGALADALNVRAAVAATAVVTVLSGVVAAALMEETLPAAAHRTEAPSRRHDHAL